MRHDDLRTSHISFCRLALDLLMPWMLKLLNQPGDLNVPSGTLIAPLNERSNLLYTYNVKTLLERWPPLWPVKLQRRHDDQYTSFIFGED